MFETPHLDKLNAALSNPKCSDSDKSLLEEAKRLYTDWIHKRSSLTSRGKERVVEMVELLNWYKDKLEVELVMKCGSAFLRRQKGQLKLESSILEEFIIQLVDPRIIDGIENAKFVTGPRDAFIGLVFLPREFSALGQKPGVELKTKTQDFVIGTEIYYKFAPDSDFKSETTIEGSFVLAVLAAECKVNFDKTMYQASAGSATSLKQGCPISKYFVLVEYLDMQPEYCPLVGIDNIFLLRHAKRLPFDKRDDIQEVERLHKDYPIDTGVIWSFVKEIQAFVNTVWYDPSLALTKGSFV